MTTPPHKPRKHLDTVHRVLDYLNSTKLFFNAWLMISSIWLLSHNMMAEDDFSGVTLLTLAVYFAGETGSQYLRKPEDKQKGLRKFTTAEFLYFCAVFVVMFYLLFTGKVSSGTYFTIVIWTYSLYNGVDVGKDFIRSRARSVAPVLGADGMDEDHHDGRWRGRGSRYGRRHDEDETPYEGDTDGFVSPEERDSRFD